MIRQVHSRKLHLLAKHFEVIDFITVLWQIESYWDKSWFLSNTWFNNVSSVIKLCVSYAPGICEHGVIYCLLVHASVNLSVTLFAMAMISSQHVKGLSWYITHMFTPVRRSVPALKVNVTMVKCQLVLFHVFLLYLHNQWRDWVGTPHNCLPQGDNLSLHSRITSQTLNVNWFCITFEITSQPVDELGWYITHMFTSVT